jgi:hypothetical protein
MEVKIKSPSLLNAIDFYIDSAGIRPSDHGVIYVWFDGLNKSFFEYDSIADDVIISTPRAHLTLRLELGNSMIRLNPPAFYFIHNDRAICILTGFERFMNFDKKKIEVFIKKISDSLPPGSVLSGDVPYMEIRIEGDRFKVLSAHIPAINK